MAKIKAAVTRSFGAPFTVETVELRAPLGREIEVTLEAVAICHSDITYAAGDWGGTLPAVYGHEAAGRISALGPEARGFALGQAVIVTLIRGCGYCTSCATGEPTLCETPTSPDASPLRDSDGAVLTQAMNCGAFAEKVVVDQSQLAPVPDELPADIACLLACGVITGVGAVVNAAGLRPGQDAVIIGAGGVGLNAIQGARLAGARRIIAVDLNPAKLEDARAFGATDTLLASDPAPWSVLPDLLGRKADAVFVTVGVAQAFEDAPNYIGTGGKVVLVGMPPVGAEARYEPVNLASAGQSLIGSKMGNTVLARDIPWLTDLWAQGRLELENLVSRRWKLEEINDAIADTKSGAARRNVIVF